MPELKDRMKREKKLVAALLAAWNPFVAIALAGDQLPWNRFAKATADAAREHIEASKRLAAVLLFLLFANDVLSFLGSLNPFQYGRKIVDEMDDDERPDDLGREIAKTSRDRWESLPENATQEDIEKWVKQNLGRDRAEAIAATEITSATTRGEKAATTILEMMNLGLTAIWVTEKDPCPVCGRLNGSPETVWAKQFPFGPPQPHPGCRCHLRYEKRPPT